jgi:hypothetical protein
MPGLEKFFLSLLQEDITKYKYFVETGTLFGFTVLNMEPLFEKLYTIEVDKNLWEKAKNKYSDKTKIEFIHGDSSKEIKKLINDKLDKNTIFFLDGHYSSGVTSFGEKHVPLYEELESINKFFKNKAIIIIDDVRIFGKLDGGVCDWRDINIKNCLNILEDRINKYYFLPSKMHPKDRLIIDLDNKVTFKNSPYLKIPDLLYNDYTLNNTIPIVNRFFNEKTALEKKIWDDKYIKSFIDKNTFDLIKKYKGFGNYGEKAVLWLLTSFQKYKIINKKVAVIGSGNPWIESILLQLNNEITTIEYNPPNIESSYNLKSIYYNEFINSNNMYDAIVSYSSIEHSGLGRYGDILDPNGDIKVMDSIYNHLSKEGYLILGVPVGEDALAWNAHRIYGKKRFPLLINKFTDIEYISNFTKKELFAPLKQNEKLGYTERGEPVIVLKKKL